MKILLVGNGFDIAHGLKTKYADFLDYINGLCDNINNELDKNLYNLTKDNMLVKYFSEKLKTKKIGDNWIDFEEEIKKLIVKMSNNSISNEKRRNWESLFLNIKGKTTDKNVFYNAFDSDFVRLNKALELYLQIVSEKEIEYYSDDILKSIEDQNTKIISFNYTDTYNKLYSLKKDIQISFVHGQIGKNNLVLGIDEYLGEEEKNSNLYFLKYKKYFQRIFNKNDTTYYNWLNEIKGESQLYIFGHSLDKTDGDILKKFILNENITTTIYYHDTNAYNRQIKNLIKIIGQDSLINFVNKKKIFFIKQAEMESVKKSDFEIIKDTRSLYNWKRIPRQTFNQIGEKVLNKIKENDLPYFNSQRACLNLYNALNYYNSSLDIKFSDILERLYDYNKDGIVYFTDDDDFEYQHGMGYEESAFKMLKAISLSNKKRNEKVLISINKNEFVKINTENDLYDMLDNAKEIQEDMFESLYQKYQYFYRQPRNVDKLDKSFWIIMSKVDIDALSGFLDEKKKNMMENKGGLYDVKILNDYLEQIESFYQEKAENDVDYEDIEDFD